MKDKKIIIGNWKMVPSSLKEARAIFQNIRSTASKLRNVQTVIAAPYIYLSDLKKLVTGHRCVVGAQDVSFEKGDAHTGEISAKMIKNIGAQYVIVGHSERRAKGETDEDVAKKVTAVTKEGLTAILCVGENERDDEGEYTKFVKKQLLESVKGLPKKNLDLLMIAYEPVWSVGTKAKRNATPEDILEIAIFIRKVLVDTFGEKKGTTVPVLYGGSVNQKNTFSYIHGCEVDGLLVGRASLKPDVFTKILVSANE